MFKKQAWKIGKTDGLGSGKQALEWEKRIANVMENTTRSVLIGGMTKTKKKVFEIPKYFPAGSLFKAMLHFIENDIKTNSVGRLIKQDSCVAECGAR